MASIIPRLVEICELEWQFFGNSRKNINGTTVVGKKEYQDGAWQRIGDYWKFIGGPYKNLTGKDRGTAWSAAFVSWCLSQAGAEDRFPYSAGHATYINTSIRNANSGNTDAYIVGHQLKGYKLKVGDLIGYWRGDKRITFENARRIGWYDSHTDIVVEVDDRVAYSIGGNISHSVTKREVRLGSDGDLTDRSENWFVVIQNKL